MSNLIETEQDKKSQRQVPLRNPTLNFLSLIRKEPTAGPGRAEGAFGHCTSPPTGLLGSRTQQGTPGPTWGLRKAPLPLLGPQDTKNMPWGVGGWASSALGCRRHPLLH